MYEFGRILDCFFLCPPVAVNAIAFGWMHIWHERRLAAARRLIGRTTLAGLTLGLMAGCASPAPPLPPSLKLPQVATGLTATRVGDTVMLAWTTPSRTTDKLLIAGQMEAVVCRDTTVAARPPALRTGKSEIAAACSPAVLQLPVVPGASQATDALPASLTTGAAGLLAYRVQLLNSMGHTAGPSAPVYAASGPAPQPVRELRVHAARQGAVLEWRPEPQPDTGSDESVELDRLTVAAPPAAAAKSGPLGSSKEPKEAHFHAAGSVGPSDPGGTVDRSAAIGHTYEYTAQRVRTVTVDGQTLELRSVPSAAVTVMVADVFPPEPPAGLVTAPGMATEGATTAPAIDLSWDPEMEPRLAGYRVYRRDADGAAWTLLTAEPVRVAAYHDRTVASGRRYAYRVTAVSDAGVESAAGAEAAETAP
jgi:hypothetical protein